jgi:hypothetical protein
LNSGDVGIDAERGPELVGVTVDVDQAGRDDLSLGVIDAARLRARNVLSHQRHPAVEHGDIALSRQTLRRIDHLAAGDQQIVGGGCTRWRLARRGDRSVERVPQRRKNPCCHPHRAQKSSSTRPRHVGLPATVLRVKRSSGALPRRGRDFKAPFVPRLRPFVPLISSRHCGLRQPRAGRVNRIFSVPRFSADLLECAP